jgi:hypothetical protein
MRNYAIIACLILLAFLLGFLPPAIQLRRLQEDYRDARLHRLLGVAMIEAQLHNYSTARQRSSEFFDAVRDVEETTRKEPDKQQLSQILARRDEIIAGLTANNETTADKLRGLFIELPNPDSGKPADAPPRR